MESCSHVCLARHAKPTSNIAFSSSRVVCYVSGSGGVLKLVHWVVHFAFCSVCTRRLIGLLTLAHPMALHSVVTLHVTCAVFDITLLTFERVLEFCFVACGKT